MMNALKWLLVTVGGIVGAAIPVTAFYFAWSWTMDQVPRSSEWAGLIKIGITFLMVATGGTLTVLCAFGLGALAMSVVIAATNP